LVLTLKPLPAPTRQEGAVPWLGRAAQQLLLKVVAEQDPALAAELHDGPAPEGEEAPTPDQNPRSQVRPYTVSTLLGHFLKGQPDPQARYALRLTAFRAEVAQTLLTATQPGGAFSPGTRLELDFLPFVVETVQPAVASPIEIENPASPWAAVTSYQALGAPFLLAGENAPRRLSLQLTSPTVFKSAGKHVPFPTPELVFGSLLERWNAWAPLAFPPEVKRYAAECLAVSRYDLKTRPVPQKSGGLRVGAVGAVTFTALSYDRYWMSVLATLAEFSRFAGLGAGTAQGLGQCRRVA